MKNLILILCVALIASAEVPVTSIAEQMKTIATLFQEHHHRFTRQVTTSPPNRFEQPACQLALQSFLQRCFVDQGLDPSVLATISSSNPFAIYVILSEVYCGDDDCQKALLNFYVECVGSELVVSSINATFRALCQMNDNGAFCYEVFFNSGTDIQDITNATTTIASCLLGNCTEECFQELTGLASFGCCTNEYFRTIEVIDINIANQYKGVWDICGFENPGYCNGTGTPTIGTPTTPTPTGTPPTGTPTAPPTTATSPTSPPPPPPTLPPRSKCARMARVFSADQNCSGGVNIGELLVNRSALSDTARTSQLHSHFCSSQSCFNQYVNTFRACLVDVSGSRRNVTARKLIVQSVYKSTMPFTRKVYCAQKDGQFCAIQFPEILNINFTDTLFPCAISPPNAKCSTDCCNAVRQVSAKYGCCFREYLGFFPSRETCVSTRVWKKCGIPNPGRCQTVLRNPRKRPRN